MSEVSGGIQRVTREGQTIRGMYRLGRMIGRGGMGEIYEADHVSIPRRFAVKILRGDYADDPEALKRFHREASIAASVGSEHIVEVYDFNQAEDGCLFMAMELLEGEALSDYLRRTGQVDPRRWLALLTQIGDGLDAAHRAGVVHRDLKPDNLFLAKNARGDEVLKILDFGISKIKTTETMQTQAGAILGTPNYMSPEQAEGGAKDVDARADIFSLGAITYEALCGEMAVGGPSLPAVFMKICFEEPAPLATTAPHLPAGVIATVNKAIQKDPTARFASVKEFAETFREGLENVDQIPVAATPATSSVAEGAAPPAGSPQATSQTTLSGAAAQAEPTELPRPAGRGRGMAIAIGVGGLMLVVGIVTLLLKGSEWAGSAGNKGAAGGAPSSQPMKPELWLDAGAPSIRTTALPPVKDVAPPKTMQPTVGASRHVAKRPRPRSSTPPRIITPPRRIHRPPPRRRAAPPPPRRTRRDDIAL